MKLKSVLKTIVLALTVVSGIIAALITTIFFILLNPKYDIYFDNPYLLK